MTQEVAQFLQSFQEKTGMKLERCTNEVQTIEIHGDWTIAEGVTIRAALVISSDGSCLLRSTGVEPEQVARKVAIA